MLLEIHSKRLKTTSKALLTTTKNCNPSTFQEPSTIATFEEVIEDLKKNIIVKEEKSLNVLTNLDEFFGN
jgi:hypothetical protein